MLDNSSAISPASAGARLDRLPASRWLTRVMVVLFLGWLVESYDIGVIGSTLPSLTHLFHLSTVMKSAVAVSATVGIVVGIVPAGRLADRFGRKTLLVWGTVAYSLLSLATAFSPNVTTVIALRFTAGLAMGAVFPLPYVYGTELCPPAIRGRFTGFADSFLSVGYFASPLLAIWLIPSISDPNGWRIMFAIGALPLVFAVIAHRTLPESPRWYEAIGRRSEAERELAEIERRVELEIGRPLPPPPTERFAPPPSTRTFRSLLRGGYLRRSLVLWATFGGTFFLFYSIQVYMPTVVHQMGFSLTSAFAFTTVIVIASIPGKLVEAWLVDRVGRKPVIVGFGLVAAVAALGFGFLRGALPVLVVGCVMAFFGIGLDPAVKVYTAESFPTALRATGTASTEGFGRLLAGIIGPAFVPPLLVIGGPALAYSVVGVVALLAVLTVLLFGEETKARTVEELSPAGPAERSASPVPAFPGAR